MSSSRPVSQRIRQEDHGDWRMRRVELIDQEARASRRSTE